MLRTIIYRLFIAPPIQRLVTMLQTENCLDDSALCLLADVIATAGGSDDDILAALGLDPGQFRPDITLQEA